MKCSCLLYKSIKDAVLGGGSISGTSTITQQLARNIYLTDKMQERSLSRKITEAYYAVILEKNLSKSEILEAYLNTVNFGSGYGVQTAAQAYFSKDIQDVTLFEAAALAAMPQLPTTYALVKQVSADSVTEDTDKPVSYTHLPRPHRSPYRWQSEKSPVPRCLFLIHGKNPARCHPAD